MSTYDHCAKCGAMCIHLNVEGHIHHGRPVVCLNTKACQRRIRKQKRGKK